MAAFRAGAALKASALQNRSLSWIAMPKVASLLDCYSSFRVRGGLGSRRLLKQASWTN